MMLSKVSHTCARITAGVAFAAILLIGGGGVAESAPRPPSKPGYSVEYATGKGSGWKSGKTYSSRSQAYRVGLRHKLQGYPVRMRDGISGRSSPFANMYENGRTKRR